MNMILNLSKETNIFETVKETKKKWQQQQQAGWIKKSNEVDAVDTDI